jgi:hypothetical protein
MMPPGGGAAVAIRQIARNAPKGDTPVRDPEKGAPVFGKDHAQTKSWSGMMTRLKIIPL